MTNEKSNYRLEQPVLVQNQIGIFYGLVEEIDEKAGTARLTDGYMLPEYGYTTDIDKPCIEDQIFKKFEELRDLPAPTITELAEQGIYAIWSNGLLVSTSSYNKTPTLFVSGISIIVPIANSEEVRKSFKEASPFGDDDEYAKRVIDNDSDDD